ncbi:hypothetical protein JWG39_01525 [Desulforhopalus vacuolatus]|uniref:hypothetical protein n=1 Tax=Desulforhopalus vacuolatus TaxID=40414 RepID=UPI0019623603|nr:hypothetical protein [Desulforhopalus vacuolatus]MBM9518494.1 hypothetical protein [Desulforhopalus vacuolatus]
MQKFLASHRWLSRLWFSVLCLCACALSALLMLYFIGQPQEIALSQLPPASQENPPPFVLERVEKGSFALAITGWIRKPKQKLSDSHNMDRIEVLLHNTSRTWCLPTFMEQRKELPLRHRTRYFNSGFRSGALNCLITPGRYSILLRIRHDGKVQITDTHETLTLP